MQIMAIPVSRNNLTPVLVSSTAIHPFSQLTSDQLENEFIPWDVTIVVPISNNSVPVVSSTVYPIIQLTSDQLENYYIPLSGSSNLIPSKNNLTNVNVISSNSYVIQTTAASGSYELSTKITPVQIWKTGV